MSAPSLGSRTPHVRYPDLEASIHEISVGIARARKILSDTRTPAPQLYVALTRCIQLMAGAWTSHMEIERDLFPWMLSLGCYVPCSLERTVASHETIAQQLEGLSRAPWPRSTEAGLLSMRTGFGSLLNPLFAEIARDRLTILPAILKMDRVEPIVTKVRRTFGVLVEA